MAAKPFMSVQPVPPSTATVFVLSWCMA